MSKDPYIQVNRDFQYDALITNPKYATHLRVYLYLRLNTAYKEHETPNGETLGKGQVLRSYAQIAVALGVTSKVVRGSLSFLERNGYVTIGQRDHKPSIYTVRADAGQRYECTETLENTGKVDHTETDTGQSCEGVGKTPVMAKQQGKAVGQSLNDAETLENTGFFDGANSDTGQSCRAPYENSILFKQNDRIEINPGFDAEGFAYQLMGELKMGKEEQVEFLRDVNKDMTPQKVAEIASQLIDRRRVQAGAKR